jgi:hypothetical protein
MFDGPPMNSLFCRHNRFTADCPICSKGTVLDPEKASSRRASRRSGGSGRRAASRVPSPEFAGPHAMAGPYEEEGERYQVRLERVPGGVRLAEWAGASLRRRAPVLAAADLPGLVAAARERGVLPARDQEALEAALAEPAASAGGAVSGRSPGRAGDLQDELRVETIGEGRIRVARWVQRPGTGWERLEAPPMLPAARLAEAVRDAVAKGIV